LAKNYPLFESTDEKVAQLKIPEASTSKEYIAWIERLPEIESPVWSGLPENVETISKE